MKCSSAPGWKWFQNAWSEWSVQMLVILETSGTRKETPYFLLYWLFNRDPHERGSLGHRYWEIWLQFSSWPGIRNQPQGKHKKTCAKKKHTRRYIRESFKLFYIEQKRFLHLLMKSIYYLSTFSSFRFFPIVIRLSNKLFRCSKFLHLNWTNVHHGFCHASFKISLNQKGLRCVNRPLEPKWPLFWFEKALLWGSWTSKFGSRERYSAFLSTLFVCVWGMFQMIPLFRKKKTFDCKEIKKPPGWREPWNPVMVHYTLPETNIFALENRPNHKTKQSSSNHPLSGAKMWVFREGIWSTS